MRILLRLLAHMRPYAGRLTAAFVMLGVAGALMAGVVSTVKPLLNEVLLPQLGGVAAPVAEGEGLLAPVRGLLRSGWIADWAREHAFVEVPLLIALIFFVRAGALYFGEYFTTYSGVSMIRDLRVKLYGKIAYQSLAFFHVHPTGSLISRVLNDVQGLQRIATTSLADGVRAAAMIPFLLAVALYHEWRMSLLSLVVLPLLGYPMVRLGRRLRRAATASQEHMARVAHTLNESLAGVRVVQAFGMEAYEIGRVSGAVEDLRRAELKAGRTSALAPALMEICGASAGAALFYVAGLAIAKNRLDPGDFAVVLFSLGLLFTCVRRLNAVYGEFQRALAAAIRIFDLIDTERVIRDLPGAAPLAPFGRAIKFEGVGFSYGDELVLRGIELTIAQGEVIALVGPSGSGKTTLANLLPRFYDPVAGRITIDGVDLRQVTLSSLRAQIGLVTQETVLFDDTVRANIAYGRADVPLARVIEVARAAHAHGFIERLPQGYDTVLGERGSRLSVGQRQRLAIARALLKDPPILVLDEATSALDAESETAVQRALEVLMSGRTSIVIAHRLATVRRADRILVLEQGRIVEQGGHEALLALQGLYARLHALQFQEAPP